MINDFSWIVELNLWPTDIIHLNSQVILSPIFNRMHKGVNG